MKNTIERIKATQKHRWNKRKYWMMFGIPVGSLGMFIIVILFTYGYNAGMEATNTQEFCISCHEMRNNVFEEYKLSIHYKNKSGIRATCSDCHVPKSWNLKIVSKIYATKDLYHKILGTVDTPEKFESHRLRMAEIVWEKMKKSDWL